MVGSAEPRLAQLQRLSGTSGFLLALGTLAGLCSWGAGTRSDQPTNPVTSF